MEQKNRLLILSIDGTPFTLLGDLIQKGLMPHWARLAGKADFRQMDSVLPPVSSSAWASFLTGRSPAEHGIMGFVDRNPGTMEWLLPKGDAIRGETILQNLSKKKKRIFFMNVPMTCPPQPVNGIIIGGFLADDLAAATYPAHIGTLLKARGYRIDADTELAKHDLSAFVEHLQQVLDKRVETMWHFWRQERWDFFMTHIMESDRLFHFLWEYYQKGQAPYAHMFEQFFVKIDAVIGSICRELPEDTALLLLSDHGFTTLNKEVSLNRWLYDLGLLRWKTMPPQSLKDLHPQSKAYALYPGRLFVNLKGREKEGSVAAGTEYEEVRAFLRSALLKLRDEEGNPVIKEVIIREELSGHAAGIPDLKESAADLNRLPDLLAAPYDGYDLKGRLWDERIFEKTIFNGMHTFDDAFVLGQGIVLPERRLSIKDLADVILDFFE